MSPRRRPRLLCVLTALFAVAAVIASAPTANAVGAVAIPPRGVYTCAWIAANPAAAAQANVTCDLSTFQRAQLGGAVVLPLANGCQNVPSSGQVGQGVYAWSPYEYSNKWGWYAYNSPANYTWYVQKTDGTNYVSGNEVDTSSHNVTVPYNVYRWGAQNHSQTAERWYVCWFTT